MCESGIVVVDGKTEFLLGVTEPDDKGQVFTVLCCPECKEPCVFFGDDGKEYFMAIIEDELVQVWIT